MTPDNKAAELFSAYYNITCDVIQAKRCCDLHISEIIQETRSDLKDWWTEVNKIIQAKGERLLVSI